MTQNGQIATDLLSAAVAAGKAGHVRHARLLLGLLVREKPDNEQAWLELARLYEREPASDSRRTQECLQQVLRINPHNRAAQSKLRQLERQHADGPAGPRTSPAQAKDPAAQSAVLNARGLFLIGACALVLLSALAVLTWGIPGSPLAWATSTPTPTLTPLPTATPTATPTPSISDRVAEQIPQLEQAWEERDWQAALDRLARISTLDASYPGLSTAQCDTYLHWAQEVEGQCQIERAHELYRKALAVCTGRDDVYLAKADAMRYLSGKWRYDHQLWSQAAQVLQELYEAQPQYAAGCQESLVDAHGASGPAPLALDVQTLLRNSLVASSRLHLEQNEPDRALEPAQRALEMSPDDQDVIELLNTIQLELKPPPTPAPQPRPSTGKRIEVSISKQRMYVYQGQTLIHNWVVSTGKGGGTATGRFRVQSRIPEAWGGQWSLRMPYWLGIYWVGRIENGIHALPINADGTMLWAGYLGTPVSFGCIILSTENARTLYHWADIGTPVWIYH